MAAKPIKFIVGETVHVKATGVAVTVRAQFDKNVLVARKEGGQWTYTADQLERPQAEVVCRI